MTRITRTGLAIMALLIAAPACAQKPDRNMTPQRVTEAPRTYPMPQIRPPCGLVPLVLRRCR